MKTTPLPNVTVKIADALRTRTLGASQVHTQACSVRQALNKLAESDPDLARRLFSSDGTLRRTVVVCVDGQDIRLRQGLDTALGDNAEVVLVAAISGG